MNTGVPPGGPRDEEVLRSALQQCDDVSRWINKNLSYANLPGDTRQQIAYACWDVALEHYDSIVQLTKWERYGTMLSLLRVLFESIIRGCWFAQCASDEQIEWFRNRDNLPEGYSFETLIKEFEKAVNSDIGALLKLKQDWWKQMNSFTHTGMHQITRRFRPGTTVQPNYIGANYSIDLIVEGLNFAALITLFAAAQIAGTAKNEELATAFLIGMEGFQPH